MSSGLRIEIRGTVQGVGFRPWVYRLAHQVGVTGRVRNHPQGVTIEAFGGDVALAALVARLRHEAPPPARIRELTTVDIPDEPADDFVIETSTTGGARALSIPPDLATCPACAAEIADPADRRFGYAFTNCTACGPRFTIATGVPYDRGATTMAPFRMCPTCRREYDSVDDRRFHAQPNACPDCGPRLALRGADGRPLLAPDPLAAAVTGLLAGAIVAVKGLGGFHLACDATDPAVIATLRQRKHRDDKPFAVMVRDLDAARALAEIGVEEAALLASPERPIVLVRRRPDAAVAAAVAPDSDLLGLFLPYTPLHHLLLAAVGRPLVMTSANLAEEPICADETEAAVRLRGIADLLLVHDRAIATRCDDSVARVIAGHPTILRRSRGYVPRAVPLARPVALPILACGAHAIERLETLLRITPEVIAHDMHPGYLSTRYARSRAAVQHVAVQHHHAHVVSAMAEHGLTGPVIGVAYDGTGWGTDGTAWGGEVMLARHDGFTRLATFRPITLAGGGAAIQAPWRIASALLDDAFAGDPPLDALALYRDLPAAEVEVVRQMIRTGLNAPRARGVGRYFDGIAALVLARPRAGHEAQLAMAWDRVADPGERRPYPWQVDRRPGGTTGAMAEPVPEIDLRPLVRAVVEDVVTRTAAATIAARFHETIIAATAAVVREAVAEVGRLPVMLTGGCFQNPRLAVGVRAALTGLDVRLHGEVPPGDGGLALGQAVVADAIVRSQP
jgi:hydrogenase maturation protein HypF